MLYHIYELQQAMMTPARLSAELVRMANRNPFNPLSHTQAGRSLAAGAELFERVTRRFGKPAFNLDTTTINGRKVEVVEKDIADKPFCTLMQFERQVKRNDPNVLVVAPLSGHFATLLRGTVEALLPHHNIYITDWKDARQVPLSEGRFNLDDCITYIREFLSLLGPDTHVIAVCQPAVPVLAAISLMAYENDPNQPRTMTLMGGPIDPRVSKTAVTQHAENKSLNWFENYVTAKVPFMYPGAFRDVYPGFIQLSGFMSMNLDRHVGSHMKFFQHLVQGDGDSAESHRRFYNEYLAVMDLPAEFYLQTVETVFQDHALPRGKMVWHDPYNDEDVPVKPGAIKKTALLTVEGELDDISARGQTTAAHDLCYDLPAKKQFHHFQEGCGHYGIFNGRRWRTQIMPRIRHFMRAFDSDKAPVPAADLKAVPDLAPEQFDRDKHGIHAIRRYLREKSGAKE